MAQHARVRALYRTMTTQELLALLQAFSLDGNQPKATKTTRAFCGLRITLIAEELLARAPKPKGGR